MIIMHRFLIFTTQKINTRENQVTVFGNSVTIPYCNRFVVVFSVKHGIIKSEMKNSPVLSAEKSGII